MTIPSKTRSTTASTVGNRELAYAEYGDPDGVPVLFLHGTPGSHRLGELFDADAHERGVRLVAPTRPGYGQSTPWPDRSISDAGTFLTDLLDDAGVETAGIVGFSGGSAHALAAVATHPDRFTRVDAVAGATPPGVTTETPTPQRVLAGLATKAPTVLGGLFRGQAWLARRLDPSFVVDQYAADPESVSVEVRETVKADFLEAFTNSRSGAVTEFRNTSTAWDVPLTEIDPAVRFWHGDADTNVPITGARRLCEKVPNAEFHALPDADHLGTLVGAMPDVLAAQAD